VTRCPGTRGPCPGDTGRSRAGCLRLGRVPTAPSHCSPPSPESSSRTRSSVLPTPPRGVKPPHASSRQVLLLLPTTLHVSRPLLKLPGCNEPLAPVQGAAGSWCEGLHDHGTRNCTTPVQGAARPWGKELTTLVQGALKPWCKGLRDPDTGNCTTLVLGALQPWCKGL